MEWTIPGTVIPADRSRPDAMQERIRSMFLAGGMVRSQVATATGLEPHAVQNWVKRGFLAPPVDKRYTCRQFCRILIINMLKNALPMEKICGLLSYINGNLDDESDDSIDDTQLYFAFLQLAATYDGEITDRERLKQCIHRSLAGYREPIPGAKQRVEQVLEIMLVAWWASQLQSRAQNMLSALTMKGEQNDG